MARSVNSEGKTSGKTTRKQETAERKLQQALDSLPRCGFVSKNGRVCQRAAGEGTQHLGKSHCFKHENTKRVSGEAKAIDEAVQKMNGMAVTVEVTPAQALAGVLHLSAGQLQYVTEQVAALDEEEIFTEIGVNPWIRLQRSLMHDTIKFAKIAADAGIAERITNLAEEQQKLMASLFEDISVELKFTKTQKEALGPAIRKHLTLLAGGTETKQGKTNQGVIDGKAKGKTG